VSVCFGAHSKAGYERPGRQHRRNEVLLIEIEFCTCIVPSHSAKILKGTDALWKSGTEDDAGHDEELDDDDIDGDDDD
jgi:hypothetical protein